MIAASYKHVVI